MSDTKAELESDLRASCAPEIMPKFQTGLKRPYSGAGNEARTRDLDLGKVSVLAQQCGFQPIFRYLALPTYADLRAFARQLRASGVAE